MGKLLTKEFLSKYEGRNPMNDIGKFVYQRTYSRWLGSEGRREKWIETVERVVEYICSLDTNTTIEEAEKLFHNIFNLKQFPSGRLLWTGGTKILEKNKMAVFNCSFIKFDEFDALGDLFYGLMLGNGFGVRILFSDVKKLPKVRKTVKLVHEPYEPKSKENRLENTLLLDGYNKVKIIVGDSKEGWVDALKYYFKVLSDSKYTSVRKIIFDYNNVREKGEKLITFGGSASGSESLQRMFEKFDKFIKNNKGNKLKTLTCLDIVTTIAENVVSGNVRRSAILILMDKKDMACRTAKSELWKIVDDKWVIDNELKHRAMSNNSVMYFSKPKREELHEHIETMRYSGEPAFVNAKASMKRRKDYEGANGCVEVLLKNKQQCNLTSLNLVAFVDEKGRLDKKELYEAQKLSARIGLKMTLLDLELPEWDKTLKDDRLLGCSLMGVFDMQNMTRMTNREMVFLLKELKRIAVEEARHYAKELGVNIPLLVTLEKPDGSLSLLANGVSAGVHYSHSPHYIRRIRISSDDPLCKVCEELGYKVTAENGEEWETCNNKVIEFYCKAPEGITKYDVSAIQQLQNYKMFMKHYVEHNTSMTIHTRDEEWGSIEQWLWDNWKDVVGVSFVSLDDSFYQQMPFEAITKEQYDEYMKDRKPYDENLLQKYEQGETELDIGSINCSGGSCTIR